MKNIAVLVFDLINDYNTTVIEGISSYFEDKDDVHLVICPVNVPHSTLGEFDYHYWSVVQILKSNDIHGFIVITTSFVNRVDLETFSKELEDFSNRPVVSVSVPLNIEGAKYTTTVPDEAYEKIIEHLKNKHNRKTFAYLTGSLHGSSESEDRFNAFKKALEKNNLPFNEDLVFHGDFTPGVANEVLRKKVKTKEDINFDAILCANDTSAGGILYAFRELGVKVPEEVAVFGFDNSQFSLMTYPTLSTIDQDIPNNGRKVAEIIYRMLNGEEIETQTILQCEPIYRQSCGCVEGQTHSTAFVDSNDNYHNIDERNQKKETSIIVDSQLNSENLYKLLNLMDTRVNMKDVVEEINTIMNLTKMTSIIACFYPQTVEFKFYESFSLPDEAKVLIHVDILKGIKTSFSDTNAPTFNPWLNVVPEEFKNGNAGNYYLLPLYLRENNYGYMICRCENKNFSMTAVHLKILTNIIIHAYEFTKAQTNKVELLNRNRSLILQSKTDELTKVFNRRGFIDYGQRLIDLSCAMNKLGVIFFCDLDGLKKINDTYGHDMGDLAIQTEAKVLKRAFRDSDLVGRLSGDEFGVVAPGFPIRKVDVLRERLVQLNAELSKEAGLPFVLSISVGPIEFSPDDCELLKLLIQADKNLYEEKRLKKANKSSL